MSLTNLCEFVGYEFVSEGIDPKGNVILYLKRKSAFPYCLKSRLSRRRQNSWEKMILLYSD